MDLREHQHSDVATYNHADKNNEQGVLRDLRIEKVQMERKIRDVASEVEEISLDGVQQESRNKT